MNTLAGLTFPLFLVLKLVGASAWSWWWVLMPIVPDLAWVLTKAGLL